ncbi:234_t:CDS:1, partial [Entrophospora sp. SA101]
EILENSSDYGIYIVDRRMKSVEESVQQLADNMLEFCQKSRRQRINQRNRTERLSDILDWKLMGMEYVRARNLALHRAYPDSFAGSELSDFQHYKTKIPKPLSAPGSPRIRGSNLVDVDDITDGITNFGFRKPRSTEEGEEEEGEEGEEGEEMDEYPFPIIIKRRGIDDPSILEFNGK